jgi:fido (protein-threonine AMPylation protein)
MALHEDEGLFAISPPFGTREATRAAIDRRIYVVQLRSYLATAQVEIGHGELMALHWSIFGEAFPDLAGTQRALEIDIHGDACSPPWLIGEHLAQFTQWLREHLEALEGDGADDAETFAQQLTLAATAHARLLHIHPFPDGNGRTARVLLNLMLRRFGLRPIELKSEDNYVHVLRRAIAGEPGQLIALIQRLGDELNERLLRLHAGRARRRQRRSPKA